MAITDWINTFGVIKNPIKRFIKDESELVDLQYYVNPCEYKREMQSRKP